MGAAHLASTGTDVNSYQPQHQNHFYLEINLTEYGLDGNNITLAVDNFSGISNSNDEVELYFMNERRYVAGQAQFDAGTLTVKDFVDVETHRTLASWRNRVYDPGTGKVGWAAQYKKDANLVMVAPDGEGDRWWTLVGCWPQQVNYGAFDYNGSDPVRMECTLRYDLAFPEKLQAVQRGPGNPSPIAPGGTSITSVDRNTAFV
jgi:hypothetical protein